MPGYRVHIAGSALVGAGYGAAGWAVGDLPPVTCALAATLCGAAGMVPDLDSGQSDPLRESVALLAAVVPLMMLHRFQQWGMPLDAIVLAGAAIYLAIRFGLGWILTNHAVHRGMFHSVPAAVIAGLLTYLVAGGDDPLHRYYIAGAVVLGVLSHLVLDEIWSATQGMFGPKFKKGFGTALKFHGGEAWANLLTYVLVVALGGLAAFDASRSEQSLQMKRYARQQMEQASRMMQGVPQQPWQIRR
ncbi:MAG: metal-dependent hydrolase [Pirellulales bacterium]